MHVHFSTCSLGLGASSEKSWKASEKENQAMDAKQCPWCARWALKDNACNYVFACGLDERGNFHVGQGCGKSWCWQCGKKFCGTYIDPETGKRSLHRREFHDSFCCPMETGFNQLDFCPGGHNSHCEARWQWTIDVFTRLEKTRTPMSEFYRC